MARVVEHYTNRQLSWLEFNQRVIDQAAPGRHPLLERLKFLAISASNLDEFFMVRVGGLQSLAAEGHRRPDPSGMLPEEQLAAIDARVGSMVADLYHRFHDEVSPSLAAAGIRRLTADSLDARQEQVLEQIVDGEIYSVLTPMAVSTDGECPLLPGGSLCICVRLSGDEAATGRFAWIPCGPACPRVLTLPSEGGGGYEYMLLEDVLAWSLGKFFPGEEVLECVPFRLLRTADFRVQEDAAADLLAEMEEVLDARKASRAVRLELPEGTSPETRAFLQARLEVPDEHVAQIPGPLDLSAFMALTDLPGFDELKDEPWPPVTRPALEPRGNLFELLAEGSLLLCHPYESFDPVLRLLEQAAVDPDVLAIKQTLYRTSRESPVVAALARAAGLGKHVTVIVELKARFDEARNIEWARNLERAGVQVIYGVRGLKTHAKLCVIVRREPGGIRRYVHFGTGNYNEITARLYTDISFLTCDEDLGADATSFFNTITGYSQPQAFRRITAAPLGMRKKLVELIESEAQRKRQGQPARILAKINALVDPRLIEQLYAASQAGVEIRLIVRGICCLQPGVPGLSENISVTSIVDRFLEHSRIFYFHQGGGPDGQPWGGQVFIASADWMPRNLDRRVELLVPVDDRTAAARLLGILNAGLDDRVNGRRLRADGSYEPPGALVDPGSERGSSGSRSQRLLYDEACEAVRRQQESHRAIFVPHRAPGYLGQEPTGS